MKLTICVFFVFASVGFGQTKLAVSSRSGTQLLVARADSLIQIENESLTTLREQLSDLLKRLATLTAEYKEEHPNVKTIRAQIEQMQSVVNSAPSITPLKGNVEIKTDTVVITADEADYHAATGDIEPRGSVRVKLISK